VTEREALALAIDMAGAPACLAHSLNVTRQELASWSRVPLKHVERCAVITGIPREALNHDADQGALL
jgi:hypothetical protein